MFPAALTAIGIHLAISRTDGAPHWPLQILGPSPLRSPALARWLLASSTLGTWLVWFYYLASAFHWQNVFPYWLRDHIAPSASAVLVQGLAAIIYRPIRSAA